MEKKIQYMQLMSEIIAKQAIILGPDIAILKARNVADLVISDNGQVTDIKGGDLDVSLQKLIDEYVNLSGQIVKNALGSIFQKYPTIKQI